MPHAYTDLIRRAYRGDMAHRHVTAISTHHRIQASPGYRAAAEYVAAQLTAAGLEVAIRRFPADGRARFWTTPSFLEWEGEAASLSLLDAQGQPVELLCDFDAIATSLIQRSLPVEGEFDVVALPGKGGKDPADYAGVDVAGKVVLTNAAPSRVAELAIREHGAAGVLFDGMAAGGRTELDLPDARQYTSFWFAGEVQPFGWGFVLSPRQGRALRASLADGKPVRVQASIRSRFYPGAFEVVEAFIPGTPGANEILMVSHLCHPRPGANDNASGAAALLETAATLARLIGQGDLPAPRHGIRFIWVPEMTGTFAWLAAQEAEVRSGRWLAGLNLDMVGADQCLTNGVCEFVSLPAAGAAFADHLLNWLRQPFSDGIRYKEAPFASGSDHYILSDPSVGIPTPMINDWPDKFYHTSADTPDKVSPAALARSGALAALYAYWLAAAAPADAAWLGHLMVSRFAAQAGQEAAAAAEKLATLQNRGRTVARLGRLSPPERLPRRTQRRRAGEPPPAGDRAGRPGRSANSRGRGRSSRGGLCPQPPLCRRSSERAHHRSGRLADGSSHPDPAPPGARPDRRGHGPPGRLACAAAGLLAAQR